MYNLCKNYFFHNLHIIRIERVVVYHYNLKYKYNLTMPYISIVSWKNYHTMLN